MGTFFKAGSHKPGRRNSILASEVCSCHQGDGGHPLQLHARKANRECEPDTAAPDCHLFVIGRHPATDTALPLFYLRPCSSCLQLALPGLAGHAHTNCSTEIPHCC